MLILVPTETNLRREKTRLSPFPNRIMFLGLLVDSATGAQTKSACSLSVLEM
jgi:hypothetical protein